MEYVGVVMNVRRGRQPFSSDGCARANIRCRMKSGDNDHGHISGKPR